MCITPLNSQNNFERILAFLWSFQRATVTEAVAGDRPSGFEYDARQCAESYERDIWPSKGALSDGQGLNPGY